MPNDITIDPAEVVLDEVKINPAEVVLDPAPQKYSLTQADRKRIAEGFREDPLGFIADEEQRRGARGITDKMQDPEDQRQRMALAAYFTRFNPGTKYNFVLANLDGILEKHYGKKVTVAQAWKDFHDMYHPAKATMLGVAADTGWHILKAGGAKTIKTFLNQLRLYGTGASAMTPDQALAQGLARMMLPNRVDPMDTHEDSVDPFETPKDDDPYENPMDAYEEAQERARRGFDRALKKASNKVGEFGEEEAAKVLPADYDFEAHKQLVPMQPGDVPVTYADTSALERDFGFKPSTSLRDGLRAFAEWYAEFYQC